LLSALLNSREREHPLPALPAKRSRAIDNCHNRRFATPVRQVYHFESRLLWVGTPYKQHEILQNQRGTLFARGCRRFARRESLLARRGSLSARGESLFARRVRRLARRDRELAQGDRKLAGRDREFARRDR